jgi:hypothetical protein
MGPLPVHRIGNFSPNWEIKKKKSEYDILNACTANSIRLQCLET